MAHFQKLNVLLRRQPPRQRRRHPFWRALGLVALILASALARPAFHLSRAAWRDRPVPWPTLPAGHIDDASRLNATQVAEVWDVPENEAQAEAQLAALLRRARETHLPVAIAGARHSMGGHAIAPGGIIVNMLPFHRLELDETNRVLRAGAGARWAEVLPFLAARGYSVAVMQASNNFTIGGSLSVNCHGWQPDSAPIASTVRAFRLMLASGSVVWCSREENGELFRAALGGYGLFGIILDADIDVVPDASYHIESCVISTQDYATVFAEKVRSVPAGSVDLAYGRISVAPESFGREAILTLFHPTDPSAVAASAGPAPLPAAEPGVIDALKRTIFRGSIASNYGKSLRWQAEKTLGEAFGKRSYRRSEIFNVPAELYANRTPGRTDILQEYFVPPARLADFLERLREILAAHRRQAAASDPEAALPDLLNVTVRDVRHDSDTLLAYAQGEDDVFGLVLLFEQAAHRAAAARAGAITRDLIEAALQMGGTYYLPYRLDATPEQFRRCYPQAAEFFTLKRRYDPDESFQNEFYQTYGKAP